MVAKNWTQEELEYLKDNWGNVSIPYLSKKLKRSINGIRVKAYRYGLRDLIHSGEYITLGQLCNILCIRNKSSNMKKLEKANFPVSYQRIVQKKIKVIYMDRFWSWFKKNKHLLDLSNTEKGCFGYEPEWVEIKRQTDKRAAEYKKTEWTAAEDDYLIRLLKSYRYGYRELSIMLKRTEGAIKRRMLNLKLIYRPLRADPHAKKWTESEKQLVRDMYLKGFKSCIIAEYINRSAISIQGFIERNKYFEK